MTYPPEGRKVNESAKKKIDSDENGNGLTNASKSIGSTDDTAENRSEFGLAETQNVGPTDPQRTQDFELDPDGTTGFGLKPVVSKGAARVAIPGYRILGELGRGAMGVVYKAKQELADRTVALKVMLNSDHARPEEVARFQVEAQAAARLQHPNIVQIYEVGQTGDMPYFTLEYVEGGTLSRKIAKQMLTADQAAKMLRTLASAIAYAHGRGVIHRDLKPANILLAPDGSPKIADFGLARRTDDVSHLTVDGTILGTPNYMSPEQAAGDQAAIGPLSDVYTLGAILYELLVGRPPFKAATAWEVIRQVRTAEPTPPSTLQPGVARDLETICLKCLQKEPSKRYGSAQLLSEDLERYLNNEPILARPIGSVERLVRLCRRYPREARLVGLVAALLLVMTIGASITAYQISLQRDQIKTQRDVIATEKSISDERLVTYRDTVSQLANQAPNLLDDAPLGAGTRQEFLRLISQILDRSDETTALGPSLQWGHEAVALRQGDLLLTQGAEELMRSDRGNEGRDKLRKADEQFAEAVRIAKKIYEDNPTEKSKAAANYASAVSRSATCALVSGKPMGEIVPLHKLAIKLREESLAAALEGANIEEIASRKAELGGVLFRYAEFLLKEQARDPVKYATKAKDTAMAAADNLRQAIREAPVSAKNKPRARQDLGLTLKTLAAAAISLGLDDEAKAAYSESITVLSELCDEYPNYYSYRRLLVGSANAYGDFLFGKNAEPSLIDQQYAIAMAQLKSTLGAPELRALEHGENGLAMQYYRTGLIALRSGEALKAKSAFERSALLREIAWNDVWQDGGGSSSPDLAITQRIELLLALARSGRIEDTLVHVKWLEERLQKLEKVSGDKATKVGEFETNRLFMLLGSAQGIIAEFLPEKDRPAALDRAVASIKRAIEEGFSDVDYLQNDPDLAPLQNVAAFARLLDESFKKAASQSKTAP